MMLGFLLARAGVDTIVLEKHADFFRDFRGDTIHPSTLELMYELHLLEEFLRCPHQKVTELSGQIGDEFVTIADFTHVPTHCKFLALMPQWDFLNFLKDQASRYATFHLRMQAEVTDLIQEKGSIVGVRAKTPEGPLEVLAPLTVGADGRHSVVRKRAQLSVIDFGAPMDVLWLRLTRHENDPGQTFGHFDAGKILVLLNRETYWQAAFVIPKGEAERIRHSGIEAFRQQLAAFEPFLSDRVRELHDWNSVSLLTVVIDRLREWSRPGLLCIGDAAHAMSPVGGVGINLAIQDAVAAANLLAQPLLHEVPSANLLARVQRRRSFPTRATQRVQVAVQNNVIRRVLAANSRPKLPTLLKLLLRFPSLRRIPARVIGVGLRPEHIATPDYLFARPR